jgi:hypothetical protein
MAGVLSKGITISQGEKALTNLMEIPALGGIAESVEITTLASAAHEYMNGLLNYGDSLPFKFLYEKEQFTALNALDGSQSWSVALPDGSKCSFTGECSAQLDAATPNTALTYTLSIKPDSAMTWA